MILKRMLTLLCLNFFSDMNFDTAAVIGGGSEITLEYGTLTGSAETTSVEIVSGDVCC